jgi:tetratricopeptide (TPR) repeat protein
MMALLVGAVITATAWPLHSQSRSASPQIPGIVKSISGDSLVVFTDRDLSGWLKKGTEMTFVLNQNTQFRGLSRGVIATDIQPGDDVTVRYSNQGDRLVAVDVWQRSMRQARGGSQPRGRRNLYGALAYNQRDGSYGASYDYRTQSEANARAMRECGPDCAIVAELADECAAYAAGDGAATGWGKGIWRSEAEINALQTCHGTGKNCRVRMWACTSRPETANALSRARSLMHRGVQKADRQDHRGAIEDYTQALRLYPDFANAYYNRGVSRNELGDAKGAIEDYTQAIRFDPDLALAYGNRGSARANQRDWKQAVEDLNQAIRLNPTHALFYLNRGMVRGKLDDKPGALDDLQQATHLYRQQRNAQGSREVAEAFYQLGKGKWGTLISDEKRQTAIWREAIEYYSHAVRLLPDFAEAYDARGSARHFLGDHSVAIEDASRAIHLDPAQAYFYANRASARRALADWRGAVEDYTQAIQLQPQDADHYLRRGDARYELGDKPGALEDYTQAIRLKDDRARAYDNRGAVRAELGDTPDALQDFQRAADLYQKEGNAKGYQRVQSNIRKLQQ